jgi:hypothetical protein
VSELTATPFNTALVAEEIALEATHHVDAVGWKFLIEPNTVKNLIIFDMNITNIPQVRLTCCDVFRLILCCLGICSSSISLALD